MDSFIAWWYENWITVTISFFAGWSVAAHIYN